MLRRDLVVRDSTIGFRLSRTSELGAEVAYREVPYDVSSRTTANGAQFLNSKLTHKFEPEAFAPFRFITNIPIPLGNVLQESKEILSGLINHTSQFKTALTELEILKEDPTQDSNLLKVKVRFYLRVREDYCGTLLATEDGGYIPRQWFSIHVLPVLRNDQGVIKFYRESNFRLYQAYGEDPQVAVPGHLIAVPQPVRSALHELLANPCYHLALMNEDCVAIKRSVLGHLKHISVSGPPLPFEWAGLLLGGTKLDSMTKLIGLSYLESLQAHNNKT